MTLEISKRKLRLWGVIASVTAGTLGLGTLPSCERESSPARQKNSGLALPPVPGAHASSLGKASPLIVEKLPAPGPHAQAVVGALRAGVTELYKRQDDLLTKEKRLFSEEEATFAGAKVIMNAFEALCKAQGRTVPASRSVGEELSAIAQALTEGGYTKLAFRRVRNPEGIFIDVETRQLTERVRNANVEGIETPFITPSLREGVSIFQAPPHAIASYYRESRVLKLWYRSPGANANNPFEPGKRCIVLCPDDISATATQSGVDEEYLQRFVLANEIGNYVFGERMKSRFSPSDEQKVVLGSWNGKPWSAKQYSEAYSDYVSLLASPPQEGDVASGRKRTPRFFYLNALEGRIDDYALSSAVVRSAFARVEARLLPQESGKDPNFQNLVTLMSSDSMVQSVVYQSVLEQYHSVFEPLLGRNP